MAAETYPTASVQEAILGRGPQLDDPTENYHEASRAYPGVVDPLVRGPQLLERSAELRASAARSVKRHPGVPTVTLPRPELEAATLADALAARRSSRVFGPRYLTLTELGTLLGAAYGATGAFDGTEQNVRTAPSGGALYPLELYVASVRVEGLDECLYHYDPLRHVLERLDAIDFENVCRTLTPFPELVCPSAAVVALTAMFWRSRFKYGARAYRFTLLEAGHVAQNLLLAAAALDLAAVPVGGFFDRTVDALVGADSLHEASIYLLPVGSRR